MDFITNIKTEEKFNYPYISSLICMVLIYFAPFVSLYLNYIAFAIYIYRIVRYDESVFAVDYCSLTAVTYIFLTPSHFSIVYWLVIIAAIWYILKNGINVTSAFIVLIVLLDYMLLRMGTSIKTFGLVASHIVLVYILFTKCKKESVIHCACSFSTSTLLASVYAFLFRANSAIRVLIGEEVAAYFGSSLTRFQGLFKDPNYYMTIVLVSLALLAVLYFNKKMNKWLFYIVAIALSMFGALSYSKTFILLLFVFAVAFFINLILEKQYKLVAVAVLVAVVILLILPKTVFWVSIYRLISAKNIYDFTTGRSKLLIEYVELITASFSNFFLGRGIGAGLLERGTHNLYLEIMYYLGFVGFVLFSVYFICFLVKIIKSKKKEKTKIRAYYYLPVLMFLLAFCSLQGLKFDMVYSMGFLAIEIVMLAGCESEVKS